MTHKPNHTPRWEVHKDFCKTEHGRWHYWSVSYDTGRLLPDAPDGTCTVHQEIARVHKQGDANLIGNLPSLLAENERLKKAAAALLNKIDNMTSDDFAVGAEKPEREALRAALAGQENHKQEG